jgi:DNA-binding transcriptional ArsR family regulator
MSKPEVKEYIGGFEFIWRTEKLNIKVGRLRVHTDGRVNGELIITDGNKHLYPPTSLNFTSERTRTTLAKTLSELDNRFQWHDVINQVSLIVVERAREGEPVRELWTHEDVPPPEWLVEPILYRGLPTIIFGKKAVCKSTLGLVIYTCLTLPWHDNPLGWKAPSKPIKTLLLDWEVQPNIAQYNITQLQRGMGLPHFALYHRWCALPIADDLDQLQRHITSIGAQVLIVDSLALAVGGDLKNAEIASRFSTSLRQLKCATLIIGQTSKDEEAKNKSVFGSTLFEYYARNIFEVRKVQEEESNTVEIGLYNTYHNLGRKLKAQGFRVTFGKDGTEIESCPITADDLVSRMGTGAEIVRLLRKQGRMCNKEIAEELGLPENTVTQRLRRLGGKNVVKKFSDGWGVLIDEM